MYLHKDGSYMNESEMVGHILRIMTDEAKQTMIRMSRHEVLGPSIVNLVEIDYGLRMPNNPHVKLNDATSFIFPSAVARRVILTVWEWLRRNISRTESGFKLLCRVE